MKKDKLEQALNYIFDSINEIYLITDCEFSEFSNDKTKFAATMFYLEKLADATKYIPEDIKDNHPQIDWKKIKGFRNLVVHEYLEGYDIQVIWETVKLKLPDLKAVIGGIRKIKYNK